MALRITVSDQAELFAFAEERIEGQNGWRPDSEAVGVLDGDRIAAVMILNMFHDGNAWVHFASDNRKSFATRDIIASLFFYPFVHKGLLRLVARVDVNAVDTQIQLLRLGFTVEGRERCAFQGRDVAIYAMLRHECRWIKDD